MSNAFLAAQKGVKWQGMDLWSKMMDDALQMYSGKKSATELPYFGQMQNAQQDQINKFIKQIMSQSQARGIPLNNMIGNWQEMGAKGTGNLIQQLFGQSQQGAQPAWNNWMSWLQGVLGKNKIKADQETAKMQMINQSAMQGIGMLAGGISGGLMGSKGGKSGGGMPTGPSENQLMGFGASNWVNNPVYGWGGYAQNF